jgi:hypothetical protein
MGQLVPLYALDLRDADRNYLEMIEKSRAELQTYTKEKVDEVLNLNNEIARWGGPGAVQLSNSVVDP